MNKLIIGLLLISSQSFATILGNVNLGDVYNACTGEGEYHPYYCSDHLVSFTISTPTMIIADEEVVVENDELINNLITEAYLESGEKPATTAVATHFDLTEDEVSAAVIELSLGGNEFTLEDIGDI